MAYKFTSGSNVRPFRIGDFLGVDLTSSESEVELRRSPDMLNLLMNESGNLKKRNGIKMLVHFTNPVIFMYNAQVKTSSNTIIEVLLVQTGSELLYYHSDGALIRPYENASYSPIINPVTSAPLAVSLTKPVNIIPVDSNGKYHLLIGGGLAKPYLLVLDFVSLEVGTPTLIDLSDKTLANYEDLIKTPITNIGRSPNGLVTTLFEQKNLLCQYQENTFLSDGLSANYVCSDTVNAADTKVWVKVNGAWVLKTVTTHYTVNTSTKTITFTAGNIPAVPSVIGEDNVKIRFLNSHIDYTIVYLATVFGTYGFGGLKDYMFLSGYDTTNKALLPMEYWAKRELPLYFGEDNNTTFPSNVMGYNNFTSYQAIHCQKSLNNPTVYLRSASLDASGEVIFPLNAGASGVGVKSKNTFDVLGGEPLWLSEYGVTALASTSIESANFAQDRGYYIRNELLAQNTSNAVGFVWDNRYYLCVGATVYVADSRYKSREKDSYSGSVQYEWFKWKFMNSISKVNAQCEYDGHCYIGTDDGLYILKNDTDENRYYDEVVSYVDDTDYANEWANQAEYTVDTIVWFENNPYICIVDHTASLIITPLDTDYWQLYTTIASGFASAWSSSATYLFGNIVYYGGTYWVCKVNHIADATKNPTVTSLYWVRMTLFRTRFTSTMKYSRLASPVDCFWATPVMNMNDPSVKKTLKNLWVRLEKYPRTSVKVYYSTIGITKLIKDQYGGVFDFSDVDFERFDFSTDTDPLVVVTNRSERKFMSIQFKVESDDENPFGLLEIVGKYTINNQFRG